MTRKKDVIGFGIGNFLWGANNLAPIDDVRVRLGRSVEGKIDVKKNDLKEFVNDELGGLSQGGSLKLEFIDATQDRNKHLGNLAGVYSRFRVKKGVLHLVEMNTNSDYEYDRILIHELGHGQQMEISDKDLTIPQYVVGELATSLRLSPSKIIERSGELIYDAFNLVYRIADRVEISEVSLFNLCSLENSLYEGLENLYLKHPIERLPEKLANKYLGQTRFIHRK